MGFTGKKSYKAAGKQSGGKKEGTSPTHHARVSLTADELEAGAEQSFVPMGIWEQNSEYGTFLSAVANETIPKGTRFAIFKNREK